MSDTLDNLHQFSPTHSISEAVITLHLAKKIDAPQAFIEKFKPQFSDFEETGLTFSHGIQVEINKSYLPKISSDDPQIEGFFARKHNKNKKPSIVIQNYISKPTGTPLLSVHDLEYKRWDSFLENSTSIIKKISDLEIFIVKAIGVTYVDLFYWKNEQEVPLKEIFSEPNSYLHKNFFSYKGDFQFITSGIIKKENEHEYIEKIQLNSRRTQPENVNLQIIHDVILDLKKQILLNELLVEKKFTDILTYEHSLNKKFLHNILTKKAKQKINLL